MGIRHPAVAGQFYPSSARELQEMVQRFLTNAKDTACFPKAIISPHAGYIYSGATAAAAYKTLLPRRDQITRVVLLGPSHRVAFSGVAAPIHESFETPLGHIPVDQASIQKALSLPFVEQREDAHHLEHSLEVQLPFLQSVLENFEIAPFVIGDASPKDVATLLELLWGSDETLIVVSSDLSHYHPYQCAQIIDASTSHEIERLNPTLGGEQACGCKPINGLLTAAKTHKLKVTTLDICNSGDTAGSKDGVVGYGAYALQ